MKKINNRIAKGLFLFLCITLPFISQAQDRFYGNLDWQVNLPVGNSFANKLSGWGASGEFGYYVVPNMSIGAFFSFHSNNKYIDRETLQLSNTSVITSDQQHSIFQIPFGAAFRYTFNREEGTNPYLGVKLGANYNEVSSYMNIMKVYDRTWGFYASPEIGMTLYPTWNFGIHVALYYSYSTNKSELLGYTLNGMSNVGLRLGIAF